MYICTYVYMYICIRVYVYICIYVDSLLVALIMKVEFFITRCCKRNGSWIPKDFDTSHSHPKKKRPGLSEH